MKKRKNKRSQAKSCQMPGKATLFPQRSPECKPPRLIQRHPNTHTLADKLRGCYSFTAPPRSRTFEGQWFSSVHVNTRVCLSSHLTI